MAVTAAWTGPAALGQAGATASRRFDWVADTFRCSLHTVAYVPDQDTLTFFSDTSNELGAGYSAVDLTAKTLVYNAATKVLRYDAADVFFPFTSPQTFRIAVLRKVVGSPATDPVVGYVDFGADVISGVDFLLQWDPVDGALRTIVTAP